MGSGHYSKKYNEGGIGVETIKVIYEQFQLQKIVALLISCVSVCCYIDVKIVNPKLL